MVAAEQFFQQSLHHIKAKQPLVLGFSGGGDSLALLRRLLQTGRGPVHALIVNHKMKPGADAEAAQAAKLAKKLGAQTQVLPWDGPALSGHAQARNARYCLLAQACRALGASHLLLAHTADDQVETFCLRTLAGSGAKGLAVMGASAPFPLWPEGFGLRVCRPLLSFYRADLRTELRAAALQWIEDPSNADQRYARVRMRQKLAKLAENGLQTGRVLAAIGQLQTLEQMIQLQRNKAMQQWVRFDDAGFAQVDLRLQTTTSRQVRGRVLEQVMQAVSGVGRCKHAGPVLADRWEQLLDTGRTSNINGCVMARRGQQILLARDKGAIGGRAGQAVLRVSVDTPLQPIWFDRRWLIQPSHAGVLQPVLACEGILSPEQQQKLTLVPALARAALPVLLTAEGCANILPLEAPQTILFAGAKRGMETGTCFA
ncbi:tRNA(Ile)-lysidine synthetase [hydrothermal vent metagenome]|uniref:tRNA(Ile)-lysidine synthetase n=1 Tax=hydrothermal vent metagenome TaxID=652676 RepID=A0A3B0RH30_9ZZZZ